MKHILPFCAALAFAAPDMARAGSDDPVLEIVTFRTVQGTEPEQFLNAARATETLLRDRGTLIRRFLTVDDTGLWTDVIEWRSLDEAQATAEAVMQHPDFAPFGAMIDAGTVDLRHAPILWRMD